MGLESASGAPAGSAHRGPAHSTASMASVDFTSAVTGVPSCRSSSSAASRVMEEVIWYSACKGRLHDGHCLALWTEATVPLNWLRVLRRMVAPSSNVFRPAGLKAALIRDQSGTARSTEMITRTQRPGPMPHARCWRTRAAHRGQILTWMPAQLSLIWAWTHAGQ